MPYLFHHNRRFTLVDCNQKNEVFCQFFSSHSTKPIPIASSNMDSYCAFMDEDGELYIATMPDASHLNLHFLENNRFNKHSLIANTTSNYSLSHPMLYTLSSNLYITYLSHQHDTNTYNFVQESIDAPNLTTLYTLNQLPFKIKHFSPQPNLNYIFFITHDDNYHLYALEITPQQTTLIKYLSSPIPIIDYSICYHNQIMHIIYISELHGKYQLCYFNNSVSYITSILTTLSPCKPVIFHYYNALWINIQIGREVQILLSVDNGHSFSTPINSSLQNNMHRCFFITDDPHHLTAHEIYACVTGTLKLSTIAMTDIYHLHPDTNIAPEIELLLEGLSISSQVSLATPPPPTMETINRSSNPRLSNQPAPENDLEYAKKAFMEEFSGWDLPPKI